MTEPGFNQPIDDDSNDSLSDQKDQRSRPKGQSALGQAAQKAGQELGKQAGQKIGAAAGSTVAPVVGTIAGGIAGQLIGKYGGRVVIFLALGLLLLNIFIWLIIIFVFNGLGSNQSITPSPSEIKQINQDLIESVCQSCQVSASEGLPPVISSDPTWPAEPAKGLKISLTNSADLEFINQGLVDAPVLRFLNWLVTPGDQTVFWHDPSQTSLGADQPKKPIQGAGFEHIRLDQLKYDDVRLDQQTGQDQGRLARKLPASIEGHLNDFNLKNQDSYWQKVSRLLAGYTKTLDGRTTDLLSDRLFQETSQNTHSLKPDQPAQAADVSEIGYISCSIQEFDWQTGAAKPVYSFRLPVRLVWQRGLTQVIQDDNLHAFLDQIKDGSPTGIEGEPGLAAAKVRAGANTPVLDPNTPKTRPDYSFPPQAWCATKELVDQDPPHLPTDPRSPAKADQFRARLIGSSPKRPVFLTTSQPFLGLVRKNMCDLLKKTVSLAQATKGDNDPPTVAIKQIMVSANYLAPDCPKALFQASAKLWGHPDDQSARQDRQNFISGAVEEVADVSPGQGLDRIYYMRESRFDWIIHLGLAAD